MTLTGDRIVDGNYQAVADATSDRLLSMVMALTAEVWTVRDRLRLLENALETHHIPTASIMAANRTEPDDIAAMRADRDAFIERVLASLGRPGNRPPVTPGL